MASAFLLGCPLSFTSMSQPIFFRPRNPFLHILSKPGTHRHVQYQTHRYQFTRPSPVANAIENNSSTMDDGHHHHNSKKFFKPLKITAGASLALACALSIFGCKLKQLNPSAVAQGGAADMMMTSKGTTKTESPAIYPWPGKSALKSLFDVTAMLASEKPIPSKGPYDLTSPHADMNEVDAIKMEAVRRIKVGNPEAAMKLLAYAKRCKTRPESKLYVELASVELLILMGKYKDASEYSFINDETRPQPGDARIPLYKAIVFTMIGEDEKAKTSWKQFIESTRGGPEEFDPYSSKY